MHRSTVDITARDRRPVLARVLGLLFAVLLTVVGAGAAHADTTSPSAPPAAPSSSPAAPGSSAPAPGEGGVSPDAATWSVSTPDNDQGTDRPNFSYTADPGGQIVDGITVSNYGAQPLTLAVYAADGYLTDTGSLDLLAAGEESVALGSWVTVETPTITLQPEEVVTVPFTVNIPENATPGDYAAGVVTSLVTAAEGGVAVDRRLGSRMILRVNGDLTPSLEVTDLEVAPHPTFWPWLSGSTDLTFTVTNTGNTRLVLDGNATISGPAGLLGAETGVDFRTQTADGSPGDQIALLPGDSVRFETPDPSATTDTDPADRRIVRNTVTVDGVWPSFRLGTRVEVSGTVVAAAGGAETDAAVVTAAADTSFWQIPWALLILLILIIGFVVWRILGRKRRKKAADDKVQDAVRTALAQHGIEPAASATAPSPSTGGTPSTPPTDDHR